MNSWPQHYILVGHTPVAVDLMTWAKWMDTADRKVAAWYLGKVRVSTVFLGLNHSYCGEPILFETMIFGGPLNGEMWRYETWAEAERGHAAAVALATKASADVKAIADSAGAKS